MSVIAWEDLPDDVRHAVQKHAGQVVKAEPLTGGIMPGLAVRLHSDHGDAFLKAVRNDSPAVGLFRRELRANCALSAGTPAPRMRWGAETCGWVVMVFDYIPGRDADLSPGSPDLLAVLDTLGRLADTLTPCPWSDAPSVAANIAALQEKAHRLLSKPSTTVPSRDRYARALDSFDPAHLAGDTMLHYDLHRGNLRASDGAVHIFDWSFACRGAIWIDAAMFAPRLIEAGHTPQRAEDLLSRLPAWKHAPGTAVTGLAALWTMFREYKALYGPDDVRAYRAQAASAGRAWLEYRTA